MKEEDVNLSEESLSLLSKISIYREIVLHPSDAEPLQKYGLISPGSETTYYENGVVRFGQTWGVSSRGHKILTVDDKHVKKWLVVWAKMDGLINES